MIKLALQVTIFGGDVLFDVKDQWLDALFFAVKSVVEYIKGFIQDFYRI